MTYQETVSMYEAAKAAYLVALRAQSVSKGQRSHSSQQLDDLKREMLYWKKEVENFNSSNNSSGIVPLYAKFN